MKYKNIRHIISPGCAHELTFSCFHKQEFFTEDKLYVWFIENLDICRNRGLFKIISYVIMPDHVHLLIYPDAENYDLGKILGSIKIPLTRKILYEKDNFANLLLRMQDRNADKIVYRFWQRGGGYDRNLFSKKAIVSSINYMHANPIRKGLVDSPEEWKWSSAQFYAGMQDYALRMDHELLASLL